jgi:hypothetical protein
MEPHTSALNKLSQQLLTGEKRVPLLALRTKANADRAGLSLLLVPWKDNGSLLATHLLDSLNKTSLIALLPTETKVVKEVKCKPLSNTSFTTTVLTANPATHTKLLVH